MKLADEKEKDGKKPLPGSYWPNRPTFYDPQLFDFLAPLKENWKGILEEFERVARDRSHPWPEGNLFRTTDAQTKERRDGEGWNVFGLFAFGKKRSDNCKLCPLTTSIVEAFPYPVTTAAFSILVPGAHILPHSGYIGYSDRVLRCHLGLKLPEGTAVGEKYEPKEWDGKREGCFLRAGKDYWGWSPGELLVFDDTHVHEAWNMTKEERVILLLDFQRPEKFMPPKEAITALEEEASKNPFVIGNLGEQYLDKLTANHGWEKK